MQIHPSDTNNLGFGFKRWGNESDFGIRSPRGSPKPKSSKVPWKVKCFVVLMYVVATYIAVCQIYLAFVIAKSRVSLRALIVSTKAISGAISVHIVCVFYARISKRVEEDSAVLRDPTVTSSWTGTGDLRPRSKNDDKILRILAIVATLLYVVGIVSSIVTAQVLDGMGEVSFGADIWSYLVANRLRVVGSLLETILCNGMLLVPSIVIYWYINICAWTHGRVLFFRERIYALLENSTRSVSAPEIKSLQNLYNHLWSTVSSFDEKLGKAVFIWHADFILTVILSARGIQKSFTWSTILESSSHFAYSVILFFIISLVAANIVVESNNIDYDLCRLVCHIDFSDWRASNQIMLLQEEIQQCSLAFTGWNCFTVDRGYILTVVGAVITYAVVLQQLT